MQLLTRQTLLFRVEGQSDFLLRPSAHPVSAPECIRETELFKLAIKDGTLSEYISAPKAESAPEKKGK